MKAEETNPIGFTDPSPRAQVLSHSLGGGGDHPRLRSVPDLVGITFDGQVYHPIYRPTGDTPCGYEAEEVFRVERYQVDGQWRPCPECFDLDHLDIEIPAEGEEGDLLDKPQRFRNGGCPMCGEPFDDYMAHLVNDCEGDL